jgi:hypothetical protein
MSAQRRWAFVNNIDLALRTPLREGAVKVATPLSEAPRLLALLAGLGVLLAVYRSDPFV